MKYVQYFVIAAIASSCGFIVHVFSAEWLQAWIAQHMEGQSVIPSWDVRYIAMLTSLEYGISAIVLYWLIRDKIIKYGQFKAFIILSLLLTALHGALIRQPLMDFVVGNPIEVALVQNAFKWLVWMLMSLVTVYGFERVVKKC
ncbi:hypothetical protein GA076_24015 [Vibrio parahaemolyticus]|uniref:hypothetical protein n=1 Tax=Vibrio parahaemolyticus TaxID=670 RepID=UPI001869FC8D|nr:hypothetical protein [Vibrio parahaemolyticus]EGU9031298.1 hypothetical protein [Vibrio parahaemolyticus]ELB2095391.1 hypothetical protein [Vibrio parahaemolyticus]ELB2127380.1 hypothetical protein [Vibrio parahaemolyticus]MBE4309453.1 hypothetical protein [Vibrio parahaemolyticus]